MHSGTSNRSRSNTNKSNSQPRPDSQGSTTSLQSVGVGGGFQPINTNQQTAAHSSHGTVHHDPVSGQPIYSQNTDEAMLHQYPPQQSIEPYMGIQQHHMRPQSQQSFHDLHHYPMPYPNGPPPHYLQQAGMPSHHMQHMRHASEHYLEGSPAPDDSNNEFGGAKRRKGTASSVANDQELRRLLSQYEHKSLKEIATEVQRNEGSGGKSEKAKQVFAMIWLRENCIKSTNSVRRDRVFSKYTERCGNERVPTLNPASFGKLVRIIFPNVQTRRLGVRGESKYHYVDLSLRQDDNEQFSFNFAPTSLLDDRPQSSEIVSKPFSTQVRTLSTSQYVTRPSMETADFPAPSARFLEKPNVGGPQGSHPGRKQELSQNMDCQYLNAPVLRIYTGQMSTSLVTALPSMRAKLPASVPVYQCVPHKNSQTLSPPNSQDSPIDLPDVHSYLAGTSYDVSLADSLSHLYRSYCIDVIDAFRKCKEKPFFNHHSAFNGKMTVPIAKIFAMEQLAPWIHECDMRMYKQMIRVVAPLALQEVPEQVWNVFDRVSTKLVNHLVTAFEEKCPTHVLVAKIVPAARFANMLKKFKSANAAAMHVAGMLQDELKRSQMWLDLLAMVDPDRVVDESCPPPEALDVVEGMLSTDMKKLVDPTDDPVITTAEEDYGYPFTGFRLERIGREGVLPKSFDHSQPSGPLDRWVQWLESLSGPFDKHHPQCMTTWHIRFWKSIMTQLGIGGAASYQAWWYLEAFLTSMLDCVAQVEGMLMDETAQKEIEKREMAKRQQQEDRDIATGTGPNEPSTGSGMKRKREDEDVGGVERREGQSRSESGMQDDSTDNSEQSSPRKKVARIATSSQFDNIKDAATKDMTLPNDADDDDDEDMNQVRRSGPLDLPSIHAGSSPMKRLLDFPVSSPMKTHLQIQGMTPAKRRSVTEQAPVHDDSGIDLNHDFLNEPNTDRKLRHSFGFFSDPAEGDGEVVVA